MSRSIPPWLAGSTRHAADVSRRLAHRLAPLRRRAETLPRWIWAVAAAVIVTAVMALFWLGPRERLVLAGAIGRFHPALVHLPIGALIVAAVLVTLARTAGRPQARDALWPVLAVAACGAVGAVIAGQGLASDGLYGGPTFDWHQRLGWLLAFVTASGAIAAWVDASRPGTRRWALAADTLVLAGVAVMSVTGHLGGTLTHGEGYLTERLPAPINRWFGHVTETPTARRQQPSEVVVYDALVAPILAEHCIDCHGPSKANGELRLDGPERIRAGGRTGPALVAGQAAASDLVRRIWLPPSHPEVMPPKGRPAIPVADASVLRWWIDQGASFEQSLADVEIVAEVSPAIRARVGELMLDGPTLLAVDPGPLDEQALAALAARGLPVSRLAEGVDWLQVEARGRGEAFGDAQLQALKPVATHITWMDLGGTAVTDAGVASLTSYPHLTRLHLDRTAVTDEGIAALVPLAHLESLNVFGTAVTDAGVTEAARMPALRALYVAGTGTTEDGIRAAAGANPDLVVHGALTPPAPSPSPSSPAGARATRQAPAR